MSVRDLIMQRRSIRRYTQEPVEKALLESLVDAARLAPSAMNRQPLEFIIVDETVTVSDLFDLTLWARYLGDNGRPGIDERPTAFIAVLVNKELKSAWTAHDIGAAVENMVLAALEHGVGSCWIGSLNREKTSRLLAVPSTHEIDSVLALGFPAETPVAEVLTGSVEYYKDENGTLHVPKRTLKSICHYNSFTDRG